LRNTNFKQKIEGGNMKKAYCAIPEGQIHYRFEGQGEPLLLLHAAVTSSNEYSRVIPLLSQHYRVIAMDFLGNGDSDPSPYQYQMVDHARTAISFMENLGIKKANVLGKNAGANVAAELAINWPERVNKLILSGVGYFPDPNEGITLSGHPDKNFTSRVDIEPDGSHLKEWWRRASFWEAPLDILEERVLEYVKGGPRGEEIHWASSVYNLKLRLPLINCPTLVLSGTLDPFYPVVENIKKLLPNGKLTIIQNGSIWVTRVMPKEYADAVLSFLKTTDK
jgi:pimeloyl-ACP methyl ester carboxylesterase